jgi:hypothetical protein
VKAAREAQREADPLPQPLDMDELSSVIEQVSAAPSLRQAAGALLWWARGLTDCHGAMLRLREDAECTDGWIPVVAHAGLGERFLADEGLIRTDECMCGRVSLGLTDPSLPFFTRNGSFVWGRAQTIAEEFAAEALGEVRGRCIAEGFESLVIFPIMGARHPIGVLHLADLRRDRFTTTAGTLEWACRICGGLMARGRSFEQRILVRETIEQLSRAW